MKNMELYFYMNSEADATCTAADASGTLGEGFPGPLRVTLSKASWVRSNSPGPRGARFVGCSFTAKTQRKEVQACECGSHLRAGPGRSRAGLVPMLHLLESSPRMRSTRNHLVGYTRQGARRSLSNINIAYLTSRKPEQEEPESTPSDPPPSPGGSPHPAAPRNRIPVSRPALGNKGVSQALPVGWGSPDGVTCASL